MSSFETSPDVIPASPDNSFKKNEFATPLSRNQGNYLKHSKDKFTANYISQKRSEINVPDSDDDSVQSPNTCANTSNESKEKYNPIIPSSDLEDSEIVTSPVSFSKSKTSDLRTTPLSAIDQEGLSKKNKTGIVSSTPTYNLQTPPTEWRGLRNESISDDECAIGNRIRVNKHFVIISDESEDEANDYFPENKLPSKSHLLNVNPNTSKNQSCVLGTISQDQKKKILSDSENCSNEDQSRLSSESNSSYISVNTTSHHKNISSFVESDSSSIIALSSSEHIETVDSPVRENKIDNLRDKYKQRSKEKTNKAYNKDNDSSHSSDANVSTSSTTSVRSINISHMSQAEIEHTLKSNKIILKTANLNALPDKGEKLKHKINELEEALINLKLEAKGREIKSNNSSRTSNQSETSLQNEVILEETKNSSSDYLPHMEEQHTRKPIINLDSSATEGNYRSTSSKDDDKLFKSSLPIEPTIIKESSPVQYRRTEFEHQLQMSSVAQAMLAGQRKQIPQHVLESLYAENRDCVAKNYGGKLSEMREKNMIRLTCDAVESLHRTLKTMPDVEKDEEAGPDGLKVELMPHQKRGLCWLLWRESQVPPGGIFADDMGLGKTLTMLCLVLRHKELVQSGYLMKDFEFNEEQKEENDDAGWLSKDSKSRTQFKLVPSNGTLVVCPATLLGQWEGELRKHVHRKKVSMLVYHGNNRDVALKRLSQFDIVVTTYQLVMREAFSDVPKTLKKNADDVPEIDAHDQGPLFRIGWARIILDEAHQIRNHKSKTSQAACMLRGGRRWAVTGTPVQNREMDFYSLVRFLRVSPFDNYTCWKHQLKSSSAQGLQKLNLLVRVLLLRRTKDQIDQSTGETLVRLPPKKVVQHKCSLGQEEREVYDRVFAFSRSSLIEYMKSQEEKEREKAERSGQIFRPQHALMASNNKGDNCTPTLQTDILKSDEIKAHHMLVLLLRLRQVCCHPALIRAIVDEETKSVDGLGGVTDFQDGLEMDIITQMNKMTLEEGADDNEVDRRVRDTVLNAENPVFKKRLQSTKIRRVIEELIVLQNETDYEKAVIVSQWTSMLQIVYKHLKKNKIRASAITGQVPVKDRTMIVNEFNEEGTGPRVLLLSLAAGGVGLNLVGANHLFLLDMHWNPQMEAQACDRIFRVGQKRAVKIHRFVVENSVEEKILELQQKKLRLAESVLTGAKRSISNKLTLQDIKALFGV